MSLEDKHFHNSQEEHHTVSTFNILKRPQASSIFKYTLIQAEITQQPLTNTHTHAHKHALSKSLTFRREWSLPTTLRQEVPASRSQPITTRNLMRKVPLRKSHVAVCTLDSSHDRLCFFLPVNARNPLRSSGVDTT